MRDRNNRAACRRESMEQTIHRMVRRVARRFHPGKVFLFGSQARGTATQDSDVDLLVILPVDRGSKSREEIEIGCAPHDILVSMDIIVASPDDFIRRQDIVGTIPYQAMKEGKVVYARPV